MIEMSEIQIHCFLVPSSNRPYSWLNILQIKLNLLNRPISNLFSLDESLQVWELGIILLIKSKDNAKTKKNIAKLFFPSYTKLCHFSSFDWGNETDRGKIIHVSPEINEGPEIKPFFFSNLASVINFQVFRPLLIPSQCQPASNKQVRELSPPLHA